MNRREEIRRLLRGADPAAGGELSPADRARMRSIVVAGASRAIRPSKIPRLAFALAVATVAAALFLFVPRSGHREAPRVAAQPVVARATAATPATQATPAAAPVLASTPRRFRPARPQAQPARLDDAARVTRIVFTGPEGTRILWFVGTPDAKELGS